MLTANEAAIREQAYYFWEQDGRPDGRESEYWQRAVTALSGPEAPKVARKRSVKSAEAPKASKTAAKAAASSAKAAPAKSAKAVSDKPAKADAAKKPKKK